MSRKFGKNNKPVVLVHVAFKFVKHIFDSVEDAQRVLMKWSEYVHLNLRQLHPTAGKVEFQITNENLENSTDPIKFYNKKNKKGQANLPVNFAPTVLIDASEYHRKLNIVMILLLRQTSQSSLFNTTKNMNLKSTAMFDQNRYEMDY